MKKNKKGLCGCNHTFKNTKNGQKKESVNPWKNWKETNTGKKQWIAEVPWWMDLGGRRGLGHCGACERDKETEQYKQNT